MTIEQFIISPLYNDEDNCIGLAITSNENNPLKSIFFNSDRIVHIIDNI